MRPSKPTFHVVLFRPEIPPNTGNIARLCVGANCHLHLIKPLGFSLDEKQVRRAGLDYWEHLSLTVHETYYDFIEENQPGDRVFLITKFGPTRYTDVSFQHGDVLVFGSETKGLPAALRDQYPASRLLHIPMTRNVRSLNLSNACAILMYEGLRQVMAGSENLLS